MIDRESLVRSLSSVPPQAIANWLGCSWHHHPTGGVRMCCPVHRGAGSRTGPKEDQNCALGHDSGGELAWKCWSVCGRGGGVLELIAEAHSLDCRRDFRRVVEICESLIGNAPQIEEPARVARAPSMSEEAIVRRRTMAIQALFESLELEGDAVMYLHCRCHAHRMAMRAAVGLGWRSAVTVDCGARPVLDEMGCFPGGRWRWPDYALVPYWLNRVTATGAIVPERSWFQAREVHDAGKRWDSPRSIGAPVVGLVNGLLLSNPKFAGCDVVLTEGPTDALVAQVWSVEIARGLLGRRWNNGVIFVGTQGHSPLHYMTSGMLHGRDVWYAADGDDAGKGGVEAMGESLGECFRGIFEVPDGLDLASWIGSAVQR